MVLMVVGKWGIKVGIWNGESELEGDLFLLYVIIFNFFFMII